jgi:hypothetical protein
MRVGGPYKVTITFVGFSDFVNPDVYLQLGEKTFKVVLSEVNQLQEVVVKASKTTLSILKELGRKQQSTDQIKALLLSRNIADFARLTPQAQLRGDDVLSMEVKTIDSMQFILTVLLVMMFFGLAANGTMVGKQELVQYL